MGPGEEGEGVGETIGALGNNANKLMAGKIDEANKTTAGFGRPTGFEAFDFSVFTQ